MKLAAKEISNGIVAFEDSKEIWGPLGPYERDG